MIIDFLRVVQEGVNFDIGFERGRLLAGIDEARAFFASVPDGCVPLTEKDAEMRADYLESVCPGLGEEMRGFAAGLGTSLNSTVLMYAAAVKKRPCGCGMLAVPGDRTTDGHTYMARSYEYSYDDEFIYSVTRVPGRYAHAGFSVLQSGRFDGMNEKGLCAAIASLENVRSSEGMADGVHFSVVVRRVLDECATVAEALELIQSMPLSDNFAYVLADSTGDTAKVESLCTETGVSLAVRRGGPQYAFNHYITPEHRAIAPARKRFSLVRQESAEKLLRENEKISGGQLMTLLKTPIPDGLCCSAYTDWFGTMHSILFDTTEKKMLFCLGSPERGEWFEADLSEKPGISTVKVDCPDVKVDAVMWEQLS